MRHRRISALFCVLLIALAATLLTYVGIGGALITPHAPASTAGYISMGLTVLLAVAIFSFLLYAIRRFGTRRH